MTFKHYTGDMNANSLKETQTKYWLSSLQEAQLDNCSFAIFKIPNHNNPEEYLRFCEKVDHFIREQLKPKKHFFSIKK